MISNVDFENSITKWYPHDASSTCYKIYGYTPLAKDMKNLTSITKLMEIKIDCRIRTGLSADRYRRLMAYGKGFQAL